MAGNLATPALSNFDIESLADGDMEVDVSWPGMDNSVDLRSIRVRWIRRTDGNATTAPVKATAEGWAESTTLQTVAPFMYKDVVTTIGSGTLRRVTGTANINNLEITGGIISDTDGTDGTNGTGDSDFDDAVVWAMARLEVA